MSILTSRAKSGGEKDALQAATPELRQLGQTLDLLNSQSWTRGGGDDDCCVPGTGTGTGAGTGAENSNRDEQPADSTTVVMEESRVRKELDKQATPQLLSTLFQLQNERVAVYAQFNAGLEKVLQSGNLTEYPHLTTSITASFAVISASIRDIMELLHGRGNKEVAELIKQLQGMEKDKLNLTAALHLEKIRERNERLDRNEEDGDDDRVLTLLRQGAKDLESKIGACVEQINDVLEELRYAAHELEE